MGLSVSLSCKASKEVLILLSNSRTEYPAFPVSGLIFGIVITPSLSKVILELNGATGFKGGCAPNKDNVIV